MLLAISACRSSYADDSRILGFELCCNLKYVERHGREPVTTAEHQQVYNLAREWSIRQGAICAISDGRDQREIVILVRPSATLSSNIANASTTLANARPNATGWTDILLLVCEDLTNGWPIYISALHDAVEQIVSAERSSVIARC